MKRKISDDELGLREAKVAKIIDLNEIHKDISTLQIFQSHLTSSDDACDIIEQYLTSHQLSELLVYFQNASHYKINERSSVLSVITKILKTISISLYKKFSINAELFAQEFLEKYVLHIIKFLQDAKTNQNNKDCLQFINQLIYVQPHVSLKLINAQLFENRFFLKNITIMTTSDKLNVRSKAIECVLSIVNVEDNTIANKICGKYKLFQSIMALINQDKYENIVLVLEILQKVLKKKNVFSNIKTRIFTVQTWKKLLSLYSWSGPSVDTANTTTSDVRQSELIAKVHSMLINVFSSTNLGVINPDLLMDFGNSKSINKNFQEVISCGHMLDLFNHPMKMELLLTLLGTCPDLIIRYVGYLVKDTKYPNLQKSQLITRCYECFTVGMIEKILSKAYGFEAGQYLVDICFKICIPSDAVATFLDTNHLTEPISTFVNLYNVILAWLTGTKDITNNIKRSTLIEELKNKMINCKYINFMKTRLMEVHDLNLIEAYSMFSKIIDQSKVLPEEECPVEELSEAVNKFVTTMNRNDCPYDVQGEAFKEALSCFSDSDLVSFQVLTTLKKCCETQDIKKKRKRILIEKVCEAIRFFVPVNSSNGNFAHREKLRKAYVDLLCYFVKNSSCQKILLGNLQVTELLSIYSATLSETDVKVRFIRGFIQRNQSTISPILLFGTAVHEYYSFSTNSSVLVRPLLPSHTLELLSRDRLIHTALNFPVTRKITIDGDNMEYDQNINVYEPTFVLELLLNTCYEVKQGGSFILDSSGVQLDKLFEAGVLQFLVACHSSQQKSLRLQANGMLALLLSALNLESEEDLETDGKDFKYSEIFYLLSHFMKTADGFNEQMKIPSLYTNFYVRMLNFAPNSSIYLSLMKMMRRTYSFHVEFFPLFSQMICYNDDNSIEMQKYLFRLLSISVRDSTDFQLIKKSNILFSIFSYFVIVEKDTKVSILRFFKSCTQIQKVADTLVSNCKLLHWLFSRLRDENDRDIKMNLAEILQNLKKSANKTRRAIDKIPEHLSLFNLQEYQFCFK